MVIIFVHSFWYTENPLENDERPYFVKITVICKVQVKPHTLLYIYYFTSIFQEILLGLMQFVVAVYKGWLDKHNTFRN